MSNHKGGRAAILFILLGGLGVGSLAYYVKITPDAAVVPDSLRIQEKPKAPKTVPQSSDAPRAEVSVTQERKAAEAETIRLPAFGGDISDMALGKAEVAVPSGKDPMKFLAERIAHGAGIEGARAMDVELRDHVAYVNYSPEVEKGMGSMEEGAFLRGLQLGFGQFTDVDKVAVESNGVPLASGHVDLSEPLPVVRPGEKPTEEAETTHAEP